MLPCDVFVICFRPLSSKTCGFEVSVGQLPSKNALKRYDSVAEVPEKVKKRRAIARAARGGCGGLGQLWEALAELGSNVGSNVGTKYLVPSTWYPALGTKYLVPRTWYQVLDTKYLVPSTWNRSEG